MKVLYPFEGGIGVIDPSSDWSVEDVDLPEDHSQRNNWIADFSNPHGFGIGADAWFAEQSTDVDGGSEDVARR
ncbi:hypothetical protein J2T09_005550 [Neorhizobium huautlense]|uniref:Uncharacterized protein n=1 Tax=Neorhizobium huautlense TaxID=67774 RepID=A0ABT9Q207_9HYPH|nr:hypothetical protein [Neorhizobium huautlense]MDP9840762.1 hypothetical protein [Neorhizobium huautlense]